MERRILMPKSYTNYRKAQMWQKMDKNGQKTTVNAEGLIAMTEIDRFEKCILHENSTVSDSPLPQHIIEETCPTDV